MDFPDLTPDRISAFAGAAQVVIALVGFGIAIYELRRARGAAEATRILTLVQRMRNTERDLDESLRNRLRAVRALNEWRALASEAHGLLARLSAPRPLLKAIEESRQIAAEAKAELQTESKINVGTTTHKARGAIAKVCDDVAQFTTTVG